MKTKMKTMITKNLCIFLLGLMLFGSALPAGRHSGQDAQSGDDYGISLMSDLPEEEIRRD